MWHENPAIVSWILGLINLSHLYLFSAGFRVELERWEDSIPANQLEAKRPPSGATNGHFCFSTIETRTPGKKSRYRSVVANKICGQCFWFWKWSKSVKKEETGHAIMSIKIYWKENCTGCPSKFGVLSMKYQLYLLNKTYFMKNFKLFIKN